MQTWQFQHSSSLPFPAQRTAQPHLSSLSMEKYSSIPNTFLFPGGRHTWLSHSCLLPFHRAALRRSSPPSKSKQNLGCQSQELPLAPPQILEIFLQRAGPGSHWHLSFMLIRSTSLLFSLQSHMRFHAEPISLCAPTRFFLLLCGWSRHLPGQRQTLQSPRGLISVELVWLPLTGTHRWR